LNKFLIRNQFGVIYIINLKKFLLYIFYDVYVLIIVYIDFIIIFLLFYDVY